ncbi:MAG: zinc ribbon domain-containing protein [Ruminococcaceae bacterium]|nr:zinc ribbon domain-containing protein [Oscillospiraceae bacterium]
MSKYCNHCGAVLGDEILFCPSCGMRQAVPAPAPAPIVQEESALPAPKKKFSKKWLTICGGILGGIIVAAITLVFLWPTPGKAAVRTAEDILNGDFDNLEDMVPPEYWDYMAERSNSKTSTYLSRYQKTFEDRYDEVLEKMENKYGRNPKLKLEILAKEKISESIADKMKEYLDENYGIDEDSVDNVYTLILQSTIEGSKRTSIYGSTVTAIQIDSKWYLCSYYEIGNDCMVIFLPTLLTAAASSYQPIPIKDLL